MDDERPLFILAGNGPYQNRGCEAIVRGTVRILEQHFREPRFVCISHFNSKKQFEDQRKYEYNSNIDHLHCYSFTKRNAFLNFYRPKAWKYVYHSMFNEGRLGHDIYSDMLPLLPRASAVLSVGGDNYSLDYGKPLRFSMLDDLVLDHNKPMVIWGASVGPFDKMPDYERYMSHHLREITGIFVRESATIDYLKNIGVTENVHPVADPAFVMEHKQPEGFEDELPIDEEAIGLNLSPLMAKYVTGGDLDVWVRRAASIIDHVSQASDMPIYLIPHVTIPRSNDYVFMQRALSLTEHAGRDIILVPPKYNAAETKWIISRMALFAGARTHSTIAALSSCVPTLSFTYSIKAWGINKDILGHTGFCIGPAYLDAKNVAERVVSMLEESSDIKSDLAKNLPRVFKAAQNAGTELKHLVEAD